METKKPKFNRISSIFAKKKVLFSFITAIFLTITLRKVLNRLIYEYCTSIYEVMLVDKVPFFSKEAIISVEVMLLLFLLFNFIIFALLRRRYRTFVIIFLLLNIVSALHAYFFVEVDIIRGL